MFTFDSDLSNRIISSCASEIKEVIEAFKQELYKLLKSYGQYSNILADIDRLFDHTQTSICEILTDEVNLSPCYAAMCSMHSVNSAKICQWLFLKEWPFFIGGIPRIFHIIISLLLVLFFAQAGIEPALPSGVLPLNYFAI